MKKKRARRPPRARYRLEYVAVRGAASALRTLPLTAAAALGRGLTGALRRFDRRHREQVAAQMRLALGLSEEETGRMARDMYRHFGTMLAEFVRVPRLTRENVDRHVDFTLVEPRLRELLAEGKGVIFATGHIGNWEVSGAAYTLKGIIGGAVARPLDNPLLDDWIRGIRQSSGQRIWDKFGVLLRLVKELKAGRAFGILVDQDAGGRGLFVPFLGREASTIPTHADLAILTGAPIVAACIHRTGGPMRFTASAGPARRPDPSADREQERLRLLRLVNEDLGELILRDPAQWLWLHRRWKTRPPREKEGAGGPGDSGR